MLEGWCEGGLGKHRNDCVGYATMRKRLERVACLRTYLFG